MSANLPQDTTPRRIILEATNRCNLDCSICLRRSWKNALGNMTPEVFSRFLADLSAYSPPPEVFFGGYGEPLSHPEILNMIRQVADLGSRTVLITNGALLSPSLAEALLNSGLDKLWISMDSSHQEALALSQTGPARGSIPEMLAEIRQRGNGLLEALEIGLALVRTRTNDEEILQTLDLGRGLGLRSFFITNLEAYAENQAEEVPYSLESLRTPGSWRTAQTGFRVHLEAIAASDPRISIEGVLNHSQDRCPFAERGDLVLRWDGEISSCLPLLYDRTTYIGSWEHIQYAQSLGNIRDQSLFALWADKENSRQRDRLLNQEFSPCLGCRDCWLSEDNRQDCMGFEHPTCGGCLWAAGLVGCP